MELYVSLLNVILSGRLSIGSFLGNKNLGKRDEREMEKYVSLLNVILSGR